MDPLKRHSKRIVLEGFGWLLVVVGLVALVLPGPGLLTLVAGLALLATQYAWAERRLQPLRTAAEKAATHSASSWPRLALSAVGGILLMALGIVWGIQPDVASWWPLADRWWLVGGWGTGGTLIASGFIALALLVYSYLKLRDAQ